MAIKHVVTRGFVFAQPPGPATRGFSVGAAAAPAEPIAVVFDRRETRALFDRRETTAVFDTRDTAATFPRR